MKKQGTLLPNIRILDLADEKASFCSKILGDLGARVIRVERPTLTASKGTSSLRRPIRSPAEDPSFCYCNTNKLSITLDIERRKGRAIFLRLVENSDVVVETFRPGHLDRLGLSFDQLSQTNSGLILVSVTGFGQKGPRNQYRSCDLVASAFGGQMYVSGLPSTAPLKIFGGQSYYTASLFAAVGVLLALKRRRLEGRGAHLDISLQEAVAASLDHVLVRYFDDGTVPVRQGSLHWNNAFFVFPCKDGFIHMTLFQQWETLIEWLDSEGMAEDLRDEKWTDEPYRNAHVDHVIDVLTRWTKTHTTLELFEFGQLLRFPWAPVQSPEQVAASPQLQARDFFVPMASIDEDTVVKSPGIPYKFNSLSGSSGKKVPAPGEHNAKVYRSELGLSAEEIRQLQSDGII